MDLKEYQSLPIEEQNVLAAKYGITRSGLNNQTVKEEELAKIPQPKIKVVEDELPKKEVKKSAPKKTVKRSDRGGVAPKAKLRKSK